MISRLLIVVVVLLASLPVIPVLVLWQQRPLWQYNTNGTANAVAMSSDGSYVAVGAQTGSRGGGVLFFNRAGPLLWSRTVDRAISSVSISDNASYILVSGFQLSSSPAMFYENGLSTILVATAPNSGTTQLPLTNTIQPFLLQSSGVTSPVMDHAS
ncbi:MAG TPA: hypothetical protein VNA15_04850 [Candidatus Angelobacter sp.]|nr:hypothetical protein [Candidatus Angelobacter sp.]